MRRFYNVRGDHSPKILTGDTVAPLVSLQIPATIAPQKEAPPALRITFWGIGPDEGAEKTNEHE